jgi:hypothetical protein
MLDYSHPPMVQQLNALYLIVPMHVAVLFKPLHAVYNIHYLHVLPLLANSDVPENLQPSSS